MLQTVIATSQRLISQRIILQTRRQIRRQTSTLIRHQTRLAATPTTVHQILQTLRTEQIEDNV